MDKHTNTRYNHDVGRKFKNPKFWNEPTTTRYIDRIGDGTQQNKQAAQIRITARDDDFIPKRNDNTHIGQYNGIDLIP
ncbi:hypothetical protein GCM10007962_07270 [Yeosuana aromativorans]|uniref:Uncharacterized protein n=1 Tax=Yeosuana aromativorans TaxID=288019 RepID=A0A8J3BJT4_9FLAO|nr:hypothetical protein GCM10007962_07270 [Yeosuana aromativorans]